MIVFSLPGDSEDRRDRLPAPHGHQPCLRPQPSVLLQTRQRQALGRVPGLNIAIFILYDYIRDDTNTVHIIEKCAIMCTLWGCIPGPRERLRRTGDGPLQDRPQQIRRRGP